MIRVNNKKAIIHLANKSFRANRTRNIIAVIAIALTAMLFTSLFTMGIGAVESFQKATMRQAGGDGHAMLKYINDEQFDAVKDHPLIEEIAYDRVLADKVENEKLMKRHTEFWYYDDAGLQLGFVELITGTKPEKENEVIVDTKTLELLGVPQKIGAPISLDLIIRGEAITREFSLSGWWDSDPGFDVGQIFASRAYVDAHQAELQNTYEEDYSMTGCISAYFMFENSLDLEGKLTKVLKDSGFSQEEGAPNYVASNVNWAYVSTNLDMDFSMVIALAGGLMLIAFSGYLIIFNIFQISVIRDIRFYGLLKTIGTTGSQIRRIIRRQALILSVIGIPIGLFFGFFSGKALVPLLMNNSSFAGSSVSVSPDWRIFAGSAAFALITVLLSTWKPGRVAGSVSPIEAVRYTDGGSSKGRRTEKATRGAKVSQMARANMGRNKKRTVLVVLSLSLSLILGNTVMTISGSLDMNKYLSRFVDTDFLIAHADYFQNDFAGVENQVSESFIEAIREQDGFEAGGRLYGGRLEGFAVTDLANERTYNRNTNGDLFAAVYGLEDLPLDRLQLLDGELDKEKLLSGKYILEGVYLDDNRHPKWGTAHFKLGDTVQLHHSRELELGDNTDYTDSDYTVLGHVAISNKINDDGTGWDYTFYLPAQIYQSLANEPAVMSYVFNAQDDKEAAMEEFLQEYTDSVEPVMNYSSKATAVAAFEGVRETVLMVGGALSLIIGLIGVLNFINSMLTSILTRRKEFAMLQSVGMTRKQLRQMLCYEGLGYTLFTGATVLILGALSSFFIVRPLSGAMWFMSYHFILWPLLLSIPVLLILGILIPLTAFGETDKQSIVSRLREIE